MKFERFDENELRLGYTTGSCAAGASLAAAKMIETGELVKSVRLMTPAGIELELEIEDARISGDTASCAVRKYAGDDPDTTDGILIYSKLTVRSDGKINIDGGEGIGTIKRKGLFGEVGEKAINPIPKKMISDALKSVSERGYDCLIYAPDGEKTALRTYNSNLGIEGGISIIGTSGIVYPMSEDAIIKTIKLEIDVLKAERGTAEILLVPGNYGENVKREICPHIPHVQMSNYVGEALNYAYKQGFRKITVLGHVGKMSKLSMGIFNTHSKNCDTRLEAFVYYLYKAGAPKAFIDEIEGKLSAEDAMNTCVENSYGCVIQAMERGAEARIKKYLKDDSMEVRVYIYSMKGGVYDDKNSWGGTGESGLADGGSDRGDKER